VTRTNRSFLDRFAVVTPNYNLGRYLRRTIESVLANLRPGDEYYVIDGGSTDDSTAVIKDYADRITNWVSEPDGGYADAIAKGFRPSEGALMCWVNSSDVLLPGALDLARAEFRRRHVDMIFGDDYCIDDDDRIEFQSIATVGNLRKWMLFGGWTPLQDACFWRREAYDRIGGIDSSLKYAADYDFFLRLVLTSPYAYVPIAFSGYRRHEGQKGIRGAREYRREKRVAQQKALGQLGTSWLARNALGLVYSNLARARSRIFASRFRDYRHRGRPITVMRVS
jgi:glycosyltransferase involved in cell wall biosynthesis